MGNYENLKQSITEVIRTNGNQEITGAVLQNTLLTIISTVGANATFAGIATPETNPGTPDGPVFYLASEGGTYTNFNALELQDGLSILMWNGSWSSQQIFGIDDEPTAGSDNLVKSGGVVNMYGKYIDNTEFAYVKTDNEGKILFGVKNDGSIYFGEGCPTQVKEIIDGINASKVDKEEGKSLIDKEYAKSIKYVKGGDFLKIYLDEEDKIIGGIKKDGSFFIPNLNNPTFNFLKETVYILNEENYIKLVIDADDKILYGIKKDGDFVFGKIPSQIEELIEEFKKQINNYIFNTPLDILILGDSYSQNGGNWANPMINALPEGSSYKSIAVSSASLRDNDQNREIHPYSDRPITAITGNNKNTLCCQIDKLKRLISGNCRGIYCSLSITSNVTNNGSITIHFSDSISKTYNLTNGQSALEVSNIILSESVSGFRISKRNESEAYLLIEAEDTSINSEITYESDVVSCSIEVLQQAEAPMYQNTSPNVIIIEGGMNDGYDSESIEDTYLNQFVKQVENVYVRPAYGTIEQAVIGNCCIKTPIEEVNRTCFAGAYRYLCDELTKLFPNAQIFFTTCSGLGYWSGNVLKNRLKIAQQQRLCADLCSASIIDWHNDGQISIINNYPNGDGTQENPYTIGLGSHGLDQSDSMHPNARGGNKYGKLAALIIMQKYLNIN